MPSILVTVLVQTGLPGIAITLTFGQLIGQIFVEEFTLPFLNIYGCQFIIRLALAIERTGTTQLEITCFSCKLLVLPNFLNSNLH